MNLKDAVVLVTGANRSLGKVFALQALKQGARKVYATARDPTSVDVPGTVPLRLDVTNSAQVSEVVRRCADVMVLVNNAGIAHVGGFLDAESVDEARAQLETNFFGMLRLSQGFAPVLASNGGGAILNVLSVASWLNIPVIGVYSATKAAAWGLTNGLRFELKEQGTQVTALHVGFVDTDLTRGLDVPKVSAAEVVAAAYAGLEAEEDEVLADSTSQFVKASLSANRPLYLTGMPLSIEG